MAGGPGRACFVVSSRCRRLPPEDEQSSIRFVELKIAEDRRWSPPQESSRLLRTTKGNSVCRSPHSFPYLDGLVVLDGKLYKKASNPPPTMSPSWPWSYHHCCRGRQSLLLSAVRGLVFAGVTNRLALFTSFFLSIRGIFSPLFEFFPLATEPDARHLRCFPYHTAHSTKNKRSLRGIMADGRS